MSFRLAGCRPAVVNAVALVFALSAGVALAQNSTAPANTPAKPAATAPAAAASSATPAAAPMAAAASHDWMSTTKPGDATAGQGKAAACGACHGVDGNSSDPQYPKLAGQHEMYIAHQLHSFKSGERQNAIMLGMSMPLSDQDTRDIGAYFASKQSLPGVADQALVAQGEKLYRQDRKSTRLNSSHAP